MTSLRERPSLEDRISAATRAAASVVPDDGAPPLHLDAPRRTRRLPAGVRLIRAGRRGWYGQPWLPQLVAPLAATAAVIAVIAASVAVADRSHVPASPGGLAGAPPYYLELESDYSAGAAAVSEASTAPGTLASPPSTGGIVSPSATGPATASSPATSGPLVSPATTAPLVSPPATGPATTGSPGANGQVITVRLHANSPGAVLGEHAVIRDTVTGHVVAAFSAPRPFDTFVMASAAADDRTFVLAAQNISRGGYAPCGSTRLFLAHFNPADGQVALTSLPVPEFPDTSQVDGIAISPDATRLAVAVESGQGCSSGGSVPLTRPGNHLTGREEVSVYALPSGAARAWQSAPAWSNGGQVSQNAMSWAADGTLAFNYPGDRSDPAGVYLLSTDMPGSNLLADSQQAVSTDAPARVRRSHGAATVQPGNWTWTGYGVLTPDGQTVVAPVQQTLPHSGGTGAAVAEFSALTGQELRVLWPDQVSGPAGFVPYYSVVWTNPSGNVLVVAAPAASGKNAGTHSVYGVLRGRRFTPIPGAPTADALTIFSDTVIVF